MNQALLETIDASALRPVRESVQARQTLALTGMAEGQTGFIASRLAADGLRVLLVTGNDLQSAAAAALAGRPSAMNIIWNGGSASATLFDLKTLLSAVIQHNAKAVALCHNHPRGTPRPSEEDVRCTLDALKALRALDVPMLDHIIVAYDQAVSLRETGAVSPDLWVMQAPKNRVVRDWLKGVQAGG